MIFVFAVDYLPDVNLVMVVAVVADLLLDADPVAEGGHGPVIGATTCTGSLTPVPATRCATWETTPLPVPTRPCRRRLANATRMYGP